MPKKLTTEEIEKIKTLHGYGLPRKEIARIVGRSNYAVDGIVTGKRDEWNNNRKLRKAQTDAPIDEQYKIDEPCGDSNPVPPTDAVAMLADALNECASILNKIYNRITLM